MAQQSLLVKCRSCGAKNRIRLVGSTLQAVCGRCKSALDIVDKPVRVGSATFEDEVLRWPGLVLVDFWADWCSPCRVIAPILEEIATEYNGKVKITKLNIDENPGTPPKYGIRGIPTLMLFKGGDVEATKVGALSKSQLTAFLDSNL